MLGVAVLAALALAGPSPCQDPVFGLLCPNLVMEPAGGLEADRSPSRGRTVLRMSTSIVNVGDGPVEFFGERVSRREMRARQVLTAANGTRHRVATGAELSYTSVPTRGGSYWKFRDAARLELWSLDAAGTRLERVRTSPKRDYCLRDLRRAGATAGGPVLRVYPACNQHAGKQTVTLGTSVGWADLYPASYPGNWIDVTGLSGCFDILQRADPLDHVLESDETDNISQRVVRLPFRSAAPSGCPLPPPISSAQE
jgi:hypothetical protein